MTSTQSISLSFLGLVGQDFRFVVHRLPYEDHAIFSADHSLSRYSLPTGKYDEFDEPLYADYWVTFDDRKDFDAFECTPHINNHLSCAYLSLLLEHQCRRTLSQGRDYWTSDDRFRRRRIEFSIRTFNEGVQVVWLEPYFLKSVQRFGFLVDFKFRHNVDVPFSQQSQILSLSLDKNGQRNKGYYTDRFRMLREFVARFASQVFSLTDEIEIGRDCLPIRHDTLAPKTYVFADNNVAGSQFMGIKRFGPLEPVPSDPIIYFVYTSEGHHISRDLYRALRGETFTRTFPGMSKMFDYEIGLSNVKGIEVGDYSIESIKNALQIIQQREDERPIVLIFVSPLEENSREYYQIKHQCLLRRIPCQFVSMTLLRQPLELKWAISNIALQLFAKMGGIPWIVRPQENNSLVMGIGQAHEISETGTINKFFAYTILTESSGLYKELKVLGNTVDSEDYATSLKNNLRSILEKYYDQYDSFVIHSSFKIRDEVFEVLNETEILKDVLTSLGADRDTRKRFVLMKFNQRNRFFAYSETSNTKVPFESTCINIGRGEYLVWFEGLQFHRPTVADRIERPMHVQFLYENIRMSNRERYTYLQDALNLSGASWRGFNAKSLPVSVHYARLVAQFYKEFQELNAPDIDFETVRPWFL